MKIIKSILAVVVAIIAIFLITAAFVKKDYVVERKTVINQPNDVVFEHIKYLKNQDEFSVWQKLDPNIKKEFIGTDGTIGFISKWESKHPDVGVGEQEIIKIEDGKKIDYELRFIEPWESTGHAYFETTALDSSTTDIKWAFTGSFKYPTNMTLLFMDMDEMLGDDLEEGLNNLKDILEE